MKSPQLPIYFTIASVNASINTNNNNPTKTISGILKQNESTIERYRINNNKNIINNKNNTNNKSNSNNINNNHDYQVNIDKYHDHHH